MIIPDVNLLIYAVNQDSPLHPKAKTWLKSAITGSDTIGFAWNVILAFLRITTRSGAFRAPLTSAKAFDVISLWLAQPSVSVIHPGPRHVRILRDLLEPLGTGGNLASDAHLAALAIEQGAELCSLDSDFARFPGLKWRNPLA